MFTQAQIFQLILTLLYIILPSLVLPFIIPAITYLIGRVPFLQQARAKQLALTGVQAVEQMAVKATSGMSSDQKKAKAMEIISELLTAAHITVSPLIIDALIESAVYLLKSPTPIASPAALPAPFATAYVSQPLPQNTSARQTTQPVPASMPSPISFDTQAMAALSVPSSAQSNASASVPLQAPFVQ